VSVGGSEKSQFVTDEQRTLTWRWTELLHVLEVTTTGICSHIGNQSLGEVLLLPC